MKKNILVIFIFILFLSCKSNYTPYNLESGEFYFYYSEEKKAKEYLVLKDDSTFTLILYGGPYNPTCTGKWTFINKNIIKLECYDEKEPIASIVSGYMSVRERKIKIVNSNKLKMPIYNNAKRKYVMLERKK